MNFSPAAVAEQRFKCVSPPHILHVLARIKSENGLNKPNFILMLAFTPTSTLQYGSRRLYNLYSKQNYNRLLGQIKDALLWIDYNFFKKEVH